ncbi:MAG: hypothetical protein Kow0080_02480 [Candidatus Promineifilaceae bacterium]
MRVFFNKLALAMFSIVLTLGMLEIAARTFKLGTGGFWEPHPTLGWRNIPGASGWESCYGECQVKVRINSLGLRDEEIPYEKPPGTRRILFLGDSMTAGMQVTLEETFVKQVETYLHAQGYDSWQTVNAAVNGYGTDNELVFYREEGFKYEPDVVVLAVYLANDVYNNSRVLDLRTGGQRHKPFFTLDENGALVIHNYPVENTDSFWVNVGTFLKKHFQLPRFIAQTLSLRGASPDWLKPVVALFSGGGEADKGDTAVSANNSPPVRTTPVTICDAAYTPEIEEAWNITKALIQELRTEVEASGAQFMVVSIPTLAQTIPPADGVSWYCPRPNEELNTFLDEEGIPYIDLLSAFQAYSPKGGKLLYYERDFHMTAPGHKEAGRQIGSFLLEHLD